MSVTKMLMCVNIILGKALAQNCFVQKLGVKCPFFTGILCHSDMKSDLSAIKHQNHIDMFIYKKKNKQNFESLELFNYFLNLRGQIMVLI